MNKTTFSGKEGVIKWAYHTAARVSSWELAADATGGTLTGSLSESDSIKCAQQPLTFVVPRQNGRRWVWPVTELHIAGDSFSARVSPQEE